MTNSSVTLDGESLTIANLVSIARDPTVRVQRAPRTEARIEASAKIIYDIVTRYKETGKPLEYGITTGFGEFKDRPIPQKYLNQLQHNLLVSHAVGVGENTNPDDLSNYYSAEVVRAALVIRLNTFLKGHSGVRLLLVDVLQAMLNCGIIPLVPLRGSVGASGDLCPLSHLFATLVGYGRFYRVRSKTDLRDPHPKLRDVDGSGSDAQTIDMELTLREELPRLTWEAMAPWPKEGLALNNGATFSAAMLALAVHDAGVIADTADVAVSMTLEALGGCTRAFDPKVHKARGHEGQGKSAQRVLKILEKSEFAETADSVQDPYSVRCAPQVHGASRDAIKYAETVAECEINSATDNPLVFTEGEPCDRVHGDRVRQRETYSAGNFHGQPIALAADFLTIALAEFANISERRTQTLMDANHNRNLPPNLIPYSGVNSGFMIAQYTAASLVSENKVLSHPASVDSIPTSANSEDHVSMSTIAARKLRTVLGNVQSVIAIEMLVAVQALEWRVVWQVPARKLLGDEEKKKWLPKADDDRALDYQANEFKIGVEGKHESIATKLAPGLRSAYLAIRSGGVKPMVRDRAFDGDVRIVRDLITAELLTGEAK